MTNGTEPCICARPIDLRSDAEINAEIDHQFGMLERRLKQGGYPEIAPSVANMRQSWRDYSGFEPAAEPAEAAA